MTSTDPLSTLIADVARGRRSEHELFHTMLEQPLFGITPRSDDHPRLRLFMFQRPDGQMFVPLFTDEEKARVCAQSACRVIESTGRELLEMTLGALVMINPNDEGYTLYPEECRVLLATGDLGSFSEDWDAPKREVLAGFPTAPPAWLLTKLKKLYATLPFVDEAHAVDVRNPGTPDRSVLTIVIITAGHAERAARATLAATHAECVRRKFAFDVTVGDPQGSRNPLAQRGLCFYSRSESRSGSVET